MFRIGFIKTNTYFILLLAVVVSACGKKEEAATPRFRMLRKEATGLNFENVLKPTVAFNALNYMYFYNGGGVAAGDFNKDGLTDLFFTSNMGPDQLFLNQGGLKFKDVTEQAGVAGQECWTTGASVIDINNDGMLDLYVSSVGDFLTNKGRNQLFVCKEIKYGVPVFAEEAIQYGLDLVGFGTQATFFDYDLDGDLDMYQLNHSVHANGTFGQKKTFEGVQHPLSGDKLMRNDLIPPPGGKKGGFTEVTMQSGIKSSVIGYGLSVVTGDVNNDGWPDIYVGNDFHENDYLYINQHNGTFKEMLTEQIMHTSQFSMGADIGDFNNDGWGDIISLDMLPEDPYILKSSLGEDEYNLYHFKLEYGYANQYARNALQKNNGDGSFSEIGMFASVHATDWSWATFFMDFDNDGYKDLFISNGIERRMNDIDYANFRAGSEVRWKGNTDNLEDQDLQVVEKMPKIKLPNKFFRNSGNLKFEDVDKGVADNLPTCSNGAIYADLDNDGDLEVVVNNLEDEPFIYENLSAGSAAPGNHLSLQLTGNPENINAIGARAIVFKKQEQLVAEHYTVRGFQSSALTNLHVGLGDTNTIDSILLIWPDNTYQTLAKDGYNKTLAVQWKKGLPAFNFNHLGNRPVAPFQFADVTESKGINYKHKENPFVEFDREKLIPHMVSAEGPALAVADVNGDGREDVFFGSVKRVKSALYIQKADGSFSELTPAAIAQDSIFEDVDAVFADIENDGDLDLIVAAGGNEFRDKEEAMKQRAYINDGKGNFQRMDFPELYMTAACVLPADVNKDGLVDFFFGARAQPWNYGITPQSALMLNKGNGTFENVTDAIAPGLKEVGLVKNGTWADMDNDGDSDLVLAVEWEPITIFTNNNGKLEKQVLNDLKGWWNFVLPFDFDGDGDMDILAGNLGENAKFKPSAKEPLRMYVADFDKNDQIEQLLTYYVKGREIPFASHAEIIKRLPMLKKKFLMSKDYAKAAPEDLFGKDALKSAVKREVTELRSMYFENTGNGKFTPHYLPDALQFSTLNAACLTDLNGDGQQEVLLGGNFYESNIEMGRYDANFGNVLSIGKAGSMQVSKLGTLSIRGKVKRIKAVKTSKGVVYVLAKNSSAAQVIEIKK